MQLLKVLQRLHAHLVCLVDLKSQYLPIDLSLIDQAQTTQHKIVGNSQKWLFALTKIHKVDRIVVTSFGWVFPGLGNKAVVESYGHAVVTQLECACLLVFVCVRDNWIVRFFEISLQFGRVSVRNLDYTCQVLGLKSRWNQLDVVPGRHELV